jgi:hypothetical protein
MADSGPTHFYVWYTVTGELEAAVRTIGALFDALASRTGVGRRLLARRDDPSTWMEVYENVADARGFERALAELVRDLGADRIADAGKRHVERFAELADALA